MDDLVHDTSPPESAEPETGPTPSENTNRLIGLCLEAAAGRLDPELLRQALNDCAMELADAKEAFYSGVQDEEGLVEALPEAISAVMDAFDSYGDALAQARSWFARQDPHVLETAALGLADAYTALHHGLLAYEWAYLGMGDEPHAALNLMQKVMSALRQGLMDDDRLDEILDRLWDHFTKGVEVFEQDPDPTRATRGAHACRQALAGVQDMDEYFEDHDFAVLDRGYARFREGCLLLVEQIQEGVGEALAQAPTPSPQVNWVIHAARAVMDGLAVDLLQRAQEWFEPQLAESYFQFEQCATAALEGPARMAEQVPVAREGFDRLNRSLPLLRLGSDRRELLPRAIEQLERGATLLHEAWAIFMEVEEGESETLCPRCGCLNPATGRVCGTCGATLMRAVEERPVEAMPEPTGEPSHLQRLLAACEEAELGRMSAEEFSSILGWARQLLQSAEIGVSRMPGAEDLDFEVSEALGELRLGMTEFREALDELHQFVVDGRPIHLSTGTRLLVQACDRLADVQSRASAA